MSARVCTRCGLATPTEADTRTCPGCGGHANLRLAATPDLDWESRALKISRSHSHDEKSVAWREERLLRTGLDAASAWRLAAEIEPGGRYTVDVASFERLACRCGDPALAARILG